MSTDIVKIYKALQNNENFQYFVTDILTKFNLYFFVFYCPSNIL